MNVRYYMIAVVILIVVWMFRNENTCGFDKYNTICVSYNRITGQWNIPVNEHYSYTTTHNHSIDNSIEAAPAAEEVPAAPAR